MLNHPWIPGINCIWSGCIILSICCWIQFARISQCCFKSCLFTYQYIILPHQYIILSTSWNILLLCIFKIFLSYKILSFFLIKSYAHSQYLQHRTVELVLLKQVYGVQSPVYVFSSSSTSAPFPTSHHLNGPQREQYERFWYDFSPLHNILSNEDPILSLTNLLFLHIYIISNLSRF